MRYTIFGESHGPAIGVTLEGVPAGLALDWDFIRAELKRRAPGQDDTSTPRREADEVEILSGVFEGRTTGTPLCAVIRNTDTRSRDYSKLRDMPRPGHADYTGQLRYGGYNDYRGGGHFSGRLTAPLVFAGAVAKLALGERGITVTARVSNIGGISDPSRPGRVSWRPSVRATRWGAVSAAPWRACPPDGALPTSGAMWRGFSPSTSLPSPR